MSSEARETEEHVHQYLIDRCLAAQGETGNAVTMGARIIRAANRNRVVWETGATIHGKRGGSSSTFKRHVSDLIDAGWIIAVRRPSNRKKVKLSRTKVPSRNERKGQVRYHYIVKDPTSDPLAEVDRAYGNRATIYMELYREWRELLAKSQDLDQELDFDEHRRLLFARKNWVWVDRMNAGETPGEGSAWRVDLCQGRAGDPVFLCLEDDPHGVKMTPSWGQDDPLMGPSWAPPEVSLYCLKLESSGGTFACAQAHTREESPSEDGEQGPPHQGGVLFDLFSLKGPDEGDRDAVTEDVDANVQAEIDAMVSGVVEHAHGLPDEDEAEDDEVTAAWRALKDRMGVVPDEDADEAQEGQEAAEEPVADEVENVEPEAEAQDEAVDVEARHVAELIWHACGERPTPQAARSIIDEVCAVPGRRHDTLRFIATKCMQLAKRASDGRSTGYTVDVVRGWLLEDICKPFRYVLVEPEVALGSLAAGSWMVFREKGAPTWRPDNIASWYETGSANDDAPKRREEDSMVQEVESAESLGSEASEVAPEVEAIAKRVDSMSVILEAGEAEGWVLEAANEALAEGRAAGVDVSALEEALAKLE